jgi:hypothetical protein
VRLDAHSSHQLTMENYLLVQSFIMTLKQLLECKKDLYIAINKFINQDTQDIDYAIIISRFGPIYYDLLAKARTLFTLVNKQNGTLRAANLNHDILQSYKDLL